MCLGWWNLSWQNWIFIESLVWHISVIICKESISNPQIYPSANFTLHFSDIHKVKVVPRDSAHQFQSPSKNAINFNSKSLSRSIKRPTVFHWLGKFFHCSIYFLLIHSLMEPNCPSLQNWIQYLHFNEISSFHFHLKE